MYYETAKETFETSSHLIFAAPSYSMLSTGSSHSTALILLPLWHARHDLDAPPSPSSLLRPSHSTHHQSPESRSVTNPTNLPSQLRASRTRSFLDREDLDHRRPDYPRQISMNAFIKSISPCILPIGPPGAMHSRSRLCELCHLHLAACPPETEQTPRLRARISATEKADRCCANPYRYSSFPPPRSSRAPEIAKPGASLRILPAPMSSWEATFCGCRIAPR